MTSEVKTCGCGCGRPVNPGKRFVKGHFDRSAHLRSVNTEEYKEKQRQGSLGNIHKRGKKESEETRRRKSEARCGKHHTQETVQKIAEAHRGMKRSDSTRELLRQKALERGPVSDRARQSMSEAQKGYWAGLNKEDRYKKSRRIAECGIAVGGSPSYQQGWYESIKAGRVFYRSSYERRVLEAFDKDSDVMSCIHEPFSITYHDEVGQKRDYYPDFMVKLSDGRRALIEVKAKKRAFDIRNLLKYEAGVEFAKAQDMEFHVWTEASLFNPTLSLRAA